MALTALIALALGCCALPRGAWASQEKHAIPSITKAVSAGSAYLDRVEAAAGSRVRYRITLTLPEGVEKLERLAYLVVDQPPDGIAPDDGTVVAWAIDADGNRKANMPVKATRSRKRLVLSLGDVLARGVALEYGDRILVEYPADIAADAHVGDYRNVALLRYDDGTGVRETVRVMADVAVSARPGHTTARGSPTQRKGGPFDATGNLVGGWAWLLPACLVLAWPLITACDRTIHQRKGLAERQGATSRADRRNQHARPDHHA